MGPAFYQPQGGPIDLTAWFLETLLARPDKTLNLLPGGKAHAEKLTDLVVGAGSAKRTIALWSVTGIYTSPMPIWPDASNKFHPALSSISPDKKTARPGVDSETGCGSGN